MKASDGKPLVVLSDGRRPVHTACRDGAEGGRGEATRVELAVRGAILPLARGKAAGSAQAGAWWGEAYVLKR